MADGPAFAADIELMTGVHYFFVYRFNLYSKMMQYRSAPDLEEIAFSMFL
jgi:hypothetical protein